MRVKSSLSSGDSIASLLQTAGDNRPMARQEQGSGSEAVGGEEGGPAGEAVVVDRRSVSQPPQQLTVDGERGAAWQRQPQHFLRPVEPPPQGPIEGADSRIDR